MKKLVWFKEGEPIPDNAEFISYERRVVSLSDSNQMSERFLYEVPIKDEEDRE